MPRQIGQIFLAGRPVNQADDECPHDRTPLLIGVLDRRFWFQDAFAIPKKLSSARQNGFVSGGEIGLKRAENANHSRGQHDELYIATLQNA
jgi:hypothetical protein